MVIRHVRRALATPEAMYLLRVRSHALEASTSNASVLYSFAIVMLPSCQVSPPRDMLHVAAQGVPTTDDVINRLSWRPSARVARTRLRARRRWSSI